MSTDTPRTDEAVFDYAPEPKNSDLCHVPDTGPDEVVDADFARELERESASLRAEVEKWSGLPPERLAMARQIAGKMYSVCIESERLRDEIATLKHLALWAETLICNGLPPSHSPKEEWDEAVKKWRDFLHSRK